MKLLVICGPTATGKTALAFALAKQFNGELVSADSRQVYRGMDIGTGKEKDPEIPTWYIDLVNPDEAFSVAHFRKLATQAIADIHKRGKLPIVVGGTGLYIQSLLAPLETADVPPNTVLRKELDSLPLVELQKRLQKEDTQTWEQLNNSDKNNPRRLMRKIEIVPSHSNSNLRSTIHDLPSYDVLIIGLTAPTSVLYERIDLRVEERVAMGVEEEIKALLDAGYSWDLPSMNTLGYKEWKDFLSAIPAPEPESRLLAVKQWKFDEHAYARRQMTWFKKMNGIEWFTIPVQADGIGTRVSSWYTGS